MFNVRSSKLISKDCLTSTLSSVDYCISLLSTEFVYVRDDFLFRLSLNFLDCIAFYSLSILNIQVHEVFPKLWCWNSIYIHGNVYSSHIGVVWQKLLVNTGFIEDQRVFLIDNHFSSCFSLFGELLATLLYWLLFYFLWMNRGWNSCHSLKLVIVQISWQLSDASCELNFPTRVEWYYLQYRRKTSSCLNFEFI
jgi:hypothetical protein